MAAAFEKFSYATANNAIAIQVSGRLHICLEGVLNRIVYSHQVEQVKSELGVDNNVTYISQIMKPRHGYVYCIRILPTLVLHYISNFDRNRHRIYYRPALLNGCHVVEALRGDCGPVDVSEAELTRIKAEATENTSTIEPVLGLS